MPEQIKLGGSALEYVAEHDVSCPACHGTGIVWDMEANLLGENKHAQQS